MRGSRPGPDRVAVDVWTVLATDGALDALPPGVLAVLDPTERHRAAGLPTDASVRFAVGRALLRCVLADRLGCRPEHVGLRATCPRCGGPHGPVVVLGTRLEPGGVAASGPVHVSVTRAGPLVAVAVTSAGPVGIDVESPDRVAAAPMADVALAAGERDALRRRRGRGARERVLARAWVRKEAALKALGTGLTTDPSSVVVGPPPRGLRGVDGVTAGDVAVADLRMGRGRVGAVAIVRPGLVAADPGRRALPGRGPARCLVVRHYDGARVLDALPG